MSANSSFSRFNLDKKIITALSELGYETATPIQEQGIPVLLNGDDLLAQAQTGTGKTATFALPILSLLNHELKAPQALVLAPTRELAIQVAEAFQSYAKHLKGFSVAPIYGGQDFNTQLRLLKRGSQILVGTPGRLMDHLRRGTLPVDHIKTVVIDEADEMLKMGFVDDVEWILGQLKQPHQTALFSATMPSSIQKMSEKYLKKAVKIQIKQQTNAVETIDQSYVTVSRNQKLDMLTRILEAQDSQGVIVFARTKNDTAELAEKLQARGYGAAALNGDMSQSAREKTIDRLKKGQLDILVATDVAARGLDVERVTHVINYDIPYDVDSYIHRIGRTGRAGREGSAILFVTPREQRLFRDIENHIKKTIKRMDPPSVKEIHEKRMAQLKEKILSVVRDSKKELMTLVDEITQISSENDISAHEIAAALVMMNQQELSSVEFVPEVSSSDYSNRDRKKDRYKNFDDQKRGGYRGKSEGRFSNDRGNFRSDNKRDDKKPFSRDGKKSFSRDGDKPFSRDDRKPFSRDDKKPFSKEGDKPFARDGKKPFSRDDKKPFSRDVKKSFSRDDDKPFSRDGKKPFSRDDKKPFSDSRKPKKFTNPRD
jgi:ATP-dependent RNA helicase DeaD